MTTDITSTQFVWQPPLIRLTQIGSNPKIANGNETACFVDPSKIIQIKRVNARWAEDAPYQECTYVGVAHDYCHVSESPETVAMLRDKALGFAPQPKSV